MSGNVKQHSWGYEIVWAETDSYSGRILSFNGPGKTPIHFHKEANKSWFINEGKFLLKYIDTKTGKSFESEIKEGSVFHVPALMPVSIECLSASGSITESSNRKLNDEDYFLLNPVEEQNVTPA